MHFFLNCREVDVERRRKLKYGNDIVNMLKLNSTIVLHLVFMYTVPQSISWGKMAYKCEMKCWKMTLSRRWLCTLTQSHTSTALEAFVTETCINKGQLDGVHAHLHIWIQIRTLIPMRENAPFWALMFETRSSLMLLYRIMHTYISSEYIGHTFPMKTVTKMDRVTGKQTQLCTHFSESSIHLCVISSSRHFPSEGLCSARQTGNLTWSEAPWVMNFPQSSKWDDDTTEKMLLNTARG